MEAMAITRITDLRTDREPLAALNMPVPAPGAREVLVRVAACGVCHTELDEIEGRTPPPRFPVVPGHQVVGTVVERGEGVTRLQEGDRVGIAWIHSSCGACEYCLRGDDNLCSRFEATGRDAHGGYAEYTTIHEDYAFPIPGAFSDLEAAPLLCAGTIGYRSLRLAGLVNGQNLGLIGFGASAHLVIQLARFQYPDSRIFVFARSQGEQAFARELGACWAGGADEPSPETLHAAIDTTPAWGTIVAGLRNLAPGGRLVINAIRKEEQDKNALLRLDYPSHLWLEKEIKSVANVARRDVSEFLDLAARIPIRPQVEVFPLHEANRALVELKERKIRGAKVLKIS